MNPRPAVARVLLDIRETAREMLGLETKGHRALVLCYVGTMQDLITTLKSLTEEEHHQEPQVTEAISNINHMSGER